MSSETKYINSSYQDFFEKSLSKSDPDLFKAINSLQNQISIFLKYRIRANRPFAFGQELLKIERALTDERNMVLKQFIK